MSFENPKNCNKYNNSPMNNSPINSTKKSTMVGELALVFEIHRCLRSKDIVTVWLLLHLVHNIINRWRPNSR